MSTNLHRLSELPTQLLPVAAIDRSPLNPRQSWRDLEALASSMRAGQIHAVIVRPMGGRFELVDGERRWRAARAHGIERIAARVAELSDEEVFAVIFATGGEGGAAPLEPLEEAAGYAAMRDRLGLGLPAVAERCGVALIRVQRRLWLLELPDRATTAVREGAMALGVAEQLARLPGMALRESATARILEGGLGGGAMSTDEARRFIEVEVWRDLTGAPFDASDPALVPEAGPCARRDGNAKAWVGICPHWAGQIDEQTSRPHRCTHPACFDRKCEVARELLLAKHAGPGRVALTAEENAEAFPKGEKGLSYKAGMEPLQGPVPRDLLKPEVGRAPKWAEVLTPAKDGEGYALTVKLGTDQAGRVVELIDLDAALAAVKPEDAGLFAPRVARTAAMRPEGKSVRAAEQEAAVLTEKVQRQQVAREKAAHGWLADRMRERVEAGLLGLGSRALWRAMAQEAVAALGTAEARWLAKQVGQPGVEAHTELAQAIDGMESVTAASLALAALTTPRLLADGPTGAWARRWERVGEEGVE